MEPSPVRESGLTCHLDAEWNGQNMIPEWIQQRAYVVANRATGDPDKAMMGGRNLRSILECTPPFTQLPLIDPSTHISPTT
jgi:hypothetical protein